MPRNDQSVAGGCVGAAAGAPGTPATGGGAAAGSWAKTPLVRPALTTRPARKRIPVFMVGSLVLSLRGLSPRPMLNPNNRVTLTASFFSSVDGGSGLDWENG